MAWFVLSMICLVVPVSPVLPGLSVTLSEALSDCVLFHMGIVVSRSPVPQTHGNGNAVPPVSSSNGDSWTEGAHCGFVLLDI